MTDSYFAERWGDSDDPWAQADRWYEARKFDLTVASLLRRRYRAAFEPGCGAGFLTERLAPRVDHLLAMEREPRGASVARRRVAHLPNVEVRAGRIPADWPTDEFDLVVLSEVLYYLDDDDLAEVCSRVQGRDVVAVHHRPFVADHVRLGDEVHAVLRRALGEPAVHHEEDAFVLDAFGTPVAVDER